MKVMTVVGARPQFVKASAVSRALRGHGEVREVLVHTGQHFDPEMSDLFFEELDIPRPDHHLAISGGSHGDMTGRMLAALDPLVALEKPDWMLVYGDTNSTLAGALSAAKLHVPIAHVEAGLRSFNRRMPEEINRVLTDHVSTLLFCPTRKAVDNLRAEGIEAGVLHVGDVMYDATLKAKTIAAAWSSILERLRLREGDYAVATVHRAESTDDPAALAAVVGWLKRRAEDMPVVLPAHPRLRKAAQDHGVSLDGLLAIDPVGYIDMTRLLMGCVNVFTDSGGLQKEAYFHGKPCVTLRTETEWVETIDAGWNRLWTVPEHLPRVPVDEYGSGHASEAIVAALLPSAS
jgi:UDP-GlcNAc3NAcA epimerase